MPLRPSTRFVDVSHGLTGLLPIEGASRFRQVYDGFWDDDTARATSGSTPPPPPPSVASPFRLSARGLPVRGVHECLAASEVGGCLHGNPVVCAGVVSVSGAREAMGGVGFACH